MATAQKAEPAKSPVTGKKVLLVDDDATLADMYSERIKASGHQVMVKHDGEAGLKAAQTAGPDIVLLDIMMPKMNGLDVLKQLKADPKTKDIPVILLTALIQDNDQAKKANSLADGYLVKSTTMPRELLEHINSVLAK